MFKRFWWLLPIGLFLGPILGFMIAGVIGYIQPKQYESKAVVQIRPVIEVVESTPGGEVIQNAANPHAAAMELMGSAEVLSQVVAVLDLATRWGVDEPAAMDQLRSMVSASNIRGTDLVEVRVRASSPQDSMLIANQLVEEFVRSESTAAKERGEKELAKLRAAVAAQEETVEARRKALTAIIRNDGITYSPDGLSADDSADKEAFELARADFEAEQSKLEDLKVRQVSGEMQQRIADSSPIVHAEAVVPARPAAPSVTRLLLAGAGAGLLLGVLAALAVMPVLHGLTESRTA